MLASTCVNPPRPAGADDGLAGHWGDVMEKGKSKSKPKKEDVAMIEGMNVRMINRKPVLCLGEKILGEIESCKVSDAEQSTLAAASTEADTDEKEELYTLDEAFYFHQNSGANTLDLEKALNSISYLLNWLSQGGNEPIPGPTAAGLAEALDRCVRDVRYLYTVDDIFKLGASPRKVRKDRKRPLFPLAISPEVAAEKQKKAG